MKKKKQEGNQKRGPSLAPGSKEILEKSAGKEEIRRGDYTRVTTLSLDEVDPS